MESPAAPLPMMWGPGYGQDGANGPNYVANYVAEPGGAAGGVSGVYGVGIRVSGAPAARSETHDGSETGLEYPREPSGLGQEYDLEGEEDEEDEEESEDELQAGDVYGQRPGVRTRR